MKKDPVHMGMLFDFYGDMLTDKQRDYFDLYYGQDMSLTEISETEHITRQGALDVISRAEKILEETDSRMGLLSRYEQTQQRVGELIAHAKRILDVCERKRLDPELQVPAQKIMEIAEELANGV